MQRGSEGAGGDRDRESARRQSRLERPERSELKDKSFLSLSPLSPSLCLLLFHGPLEERQTGHGWDTLGVEQEAQGTIANHVFHCIQHGAKENCLNQEEPRQITALQ